MSKDKPEVGDVCITSEQLTEQWKKGELPNGYYWIRLSWGGMVIMAYHTAFDGLFELDDHYYDSDEISEVLAPVPSYDEWQASYNCMLENEVLRLKNAQLQELLKECKEVIKNVDTYYGNYDSTNGYLVINKIDEALK